MKDRGTQELGEWMYKENITCEQLAKKVGCSTSTIACLARGDVPEILKKLRKLEKVTKEKVLLKNIVEYSEKKKQRKEQSDTEQQ